VSPPCGKRGLAETRDNRAVRVATIGVYGFTAESFKDALLNSGVGLVVDVRQRRGVRGREYSWANSRRLQTMLAAAEIDYRHHRELAPTTELRQLQYAEDERRGVGKRSRVELAPEYVRRYRNEILDHVDLVRFAAEGAEHRVFALLCVEREPQACHRSLIAERLGREHEARVVHLRP
jgi:uncharacterized protein (DUF488 family)